jgi:hypothetical protein
MTSKIKLFLFLIIIIAIGFLSYWFYQSFQTKKDTSFMEEALATLNPQLCQKIKISSYFVSQDACYNYIAQKTNNKALCGKIKQKELKDNCYENVE